MITKREVRVIALAYLGLRPSDVLWDVGAGSGSIALEAGHLSPGLEVFAIERDHEAVQDVLGNVRGFGLAGIRVVEAEAPEAFSGLPDPDAVFVGGSGGRLREIVTEAIRRLRPGGRIVINCVTIENFSLGWEILNVHGLGPARPRCSLPIPARWAACTGWIRRVRSSSCERPSHEQPSDDRLDRRHRPRP